ncbi:MAG TPA: aldehyde dehydrogenase family protein, partial [Pseudomonadales bacterium]|nr:aldehyde dehydrogenase family protein [Pseudomonadales bacterium]
MSLTQLGAGYCGDQSLAATTPALVSYSPIDSAAVAAFSAVDSAGYEHVVERAQQAFLQFRQLPAPRRGEWIRHFAQWVRAHKAELAAIITLEVGKTQQEAEGEVQEVIDIADFAVGLSRQLHGLTIASERAEHRLMEQWHPLGLVGVITAFNFPMAVWAWNSCLALVCGNAVIWKPSEQTPLSAIKLFEGLMSCRQAVPEIPADIGAVLLGDKSIGERLAADKRIALVSATGSCAMGRAVASTVSARLGRSLLELGGNNAAIIAPSANLELAIRGVVFAAVGTAGQRCTTLRRLIIHASIYDLVVARLI